jgi:ribosomal protein S18 acetylase RimI-like enzyme
LSIRQATARDREVLQELVLRFREEIRRYRPSPTRSFSLADAQAELEDYIAAKYPIFVAEDAEGKILGYLVCRVQDDIVWAEQLYVLPGARRKGIGSSLYEQAERLAAELGSEAPYNWVDSTNSPIIHFLRKRGYTVLNLLELRKPRSGERLERRIKVREEEFYY